MLRITKSAETSYRVTLLLEGQIRPPWAAELESLALACQLAGQHVVMDFSGVTFVSAEGVELLKRLQAGGVQLSHCSRIVKDLLK